MTQADVKLDGWSMECRINAEDPFRGFCLRPGAWSSSSRRLKAMACGSIPGVRGRRDLDVLRFDDRQADRARQGP